MFVFTGEAEEELLFPCMGEVKSKLQSGHDREQISFVENLFEHKDFQDATRVSEQCLQGNHVHCNLKLRQVVQINPNCAHYRIP